ncbi:MAG: APC family permease [Sphingorhabdus sp.]
MGVAGRSWSPTMLVMMLFGTIIGAGWITAAGGWIAQAGSIGAVTAFALGAIVMAVVGLCFAEAAAMFPQAAGSVAFTYRASGTAWAFACGWFIVISYIATLAFFILASARLIGATMPETLAADAYRIFGNGVSWRVIAIGLVGTILITAIALSGLDFAMGFQVAIVLLLVFMALLLTGIAEFRGEWSRLAPLWAGDDKATIAGGIAAVAVTTPFWFSGLDIIIQLVRGKVAPDDLPKLGSVVIVSTAMATVFYVAVILSISILLPRELLISAKLPTYEAFLRGTGLGWAAMLVIAAGMAGVVSTWIACLLAGARILQMMARAEMMPRFFRGGEEGLGISRTSICFVSVSALLLALCGDGAVDPILLGASISLIVAFCIVCTGVLRLRLKEPERPRPYRAGRSLLIPVLGILFSVLLLGFAVRDAEGVPLAFVLLVAWFVWGGTHWLLVRKKVEALPKAELSKILMGF